MKFGEWDIIWGKVNVDKVNTIIVDYAELISDHYDYITLCNTCANAGYIVRKVMRLDSLEYEEFMSSLKRSTYKDILNTYDKVQDIYKDWKSKNSYWRYSEYDSLAEDSNICIELDVNGVPYTLSVTYNVHKTRYMNDAIITAEVIVLSSNDLPKFGECGIYYANMQDYSEDVFSVIVHTIKQPEICCTYDLLGRSKYNKELLKPVLDQYKYVTGEDMVTEKNSAYVRFAFNKRYDYVETIMMHYLLDGSIILSGSAHKVFRASKIWLSNTGLDKVLATMSFDPTSIGFSIDKDNLLFEDILSKLSVTCDEVYNSRCIHKIYSMNKDEHNAVDKKYYHIMMTAKNDENVDVVITLLDKRQLVCLSQLF